ncbi:S8 family serine peptidase [Nostoc sp. NMS9]|uniref:S8 family serine peptidase n=1 Tax=Nostoc sp. NMS9 TaxID=2815393 RepID=UPI0025F8CC70|nr:S8 family serine peptidase [Nostoc sp. NMS9]MBN3939893.1 S8 family serine peptidase [Nostoc sp. NMS9]
MSAVIEQVESRIENADRELSSIVRDKEMNIILKKDKLQSLNSEIESIQLLINEASTGEKGQELKASKAAEIQKVRELRNYLERIWKKTQLLNPSDPKDFWQALWWFFTQGGRKELSLIQTIRNNLPYDEPEFQDFVEKVQKNIEAKLFTSGVYQVFFSEDRIKQLLPEIVIIEAYSAFVIISVDSNNEEIITQLKNVYPVEKLSKDLAEDSRGSKMPYKKEQVVKFRFPVRGEWKQRIGNTGARILEPIGDSELIVSVPSEEILTKIKNFREVASVTPYEPTIRVQEEYLKDLGVEVTEEMLADARLKIVENSQTLKINNNFIPGILIARFFTEEDRDEALKTLESEKIDVVEEADINELVVDLISHSNPINAYEILKSLPGLISLEEETIETIDNHVAVPLLANGVSIINYIPELTGSGEIIAIADTGLDTGEKAILHPDFQGRVKIIKSYPIRPSDSNRVNNPNDDDGASDKYSGHGTHVAGSALGSGRMAQNYGLPPIQGMAPEAELIFQAVEQTPKWKIQEMHSFLKRKLIPPASDLLGIPSNIKTLFEFAFTNGARIHSNSWGGGEFGCYNRRCLQLDEFVWQHKDFLIVFAAGNKGNQQGTITPPGTAKNCLTIGVFADFSSRGPCQDGRYKPDVIAPGTFILSTRSCQITHYSEAAYPPAKGDYMYMSGTSMATPLIAGSAALVRQYLRTKKNISNPSAALLKAALIHSAEYFQYSYTHKSSKKWADNEQGWGRINLSRIINPPYHVEFFDQTQGFFESGQKEHQYEFEIIDNSIPLRVTLVYTDYPGKQPLGQLVNNLNLVVYNPQGGYYLGNDFDERGMIDSVNNVEGCIVDAPITGRWKIKIVGKKIVQPTQDYALVISGVIAHWKQVPR